MRQLFLVLVLMVLLVVPVHAGDCERYWDGLVGQSFDITVDGTDFTAYFNDSAYGPCPGGIVTLEYIDTQIVDNIEYTADISIDFSYSTDADYVTVEGLLFLLSDGRLILLPDDPWIFNQIIEDE
jgi:hypothetical protein